MTLGGNPVALAVPLGEEKKDQGPSDWGSWHFKARQPILAWPSSLQTMAQRSLCVWYSPWQHQGVENPLVALLLEIRAQFTTWLRLKEGAKELNRRGGLAGLALLERVIDGAAGLTLGRSLRLAEGTTDAVRRAWREAAPEEPGLGDGQRFHLLFDDAIQTLLSGLPQEKGSKIPGRLIIFIDDLDRCEEGVVVQLLESIKLYLGSPRCVFVLAIDEGAVLSALERHWAGRSDDANREYLEKLFQAIVPVPAPRPAELRIFIEAQLKEHDFAGVPACATLIEELLEPNPRKIKNFVNSACVGWEMLKAARAVPPGKPAIEFAGRFLLFQYLRFQHKQVWRLLERQPWALRVLGKVLIGTVPQRLPPWVTWEQQRMLEHLFMRSFAHILGHEGDQADRHLYLSIAEAVNLANQRIDSKRSDDCFVRYFRTLIGFEMDLPEVFLGVPTPLAPPSTEAADG
ncbi:MAG TPA: P-loop NTPase fold protein [Thermoanaerobaculia bacterium]|nr:P-loop NTPase fold protein [Thermoanaerobaculia bacterium]